MADPPKDFPQEVVGMMTNDVKCPMSLGLYQYQPLSCSKREIRLLKIVNFQELRDSTEALDEFLDQQDLDNVDLHNLLWSGSIPVSCTIEHVSLETEPVYAPLSYTWGDANHRVQVILNDNA